MAGSLIVGKIHCGRACIRITYNMLACFDNNLCLAVQI